MWNHLAQTLSQLPEYLRENITELFQDEFFLSKYQLDITNSASFQGMNKSFPTLHTHLVANRNIINKNRLPWAAAFHVEFSMFSNKTDILEIDSHLKDVNSLIEATFGRKNNLKKFNPETHSDKSQEDHENNIITDDEEAKQKQMKSTKQLEAQLSVKILGNELYTYNIYDLFAHIKRFDQDFDLRKNLESGEFIDEEQIINAIESYTFPTSIGFPIEIGANTSVLFMAKSNVTSDIRESSLSTFDLVLHTTADLILNLSGSMVVDAHIFKKGLHLTIDSPIQKNMMCSLSLAEDKMVDYKIEMPDNNSHFDLKSNVEEIF